MSNTKKSILALTTKCLVGGFFINVIVAVGCRILAQQWPRPATDLVRTHELDRLQRLSAKYHKPDAREQLYWGSYMTNIGYSELTFVSHARIATERFPAFEQFIIVEIEAGWPLVSLRRIKRRDLEYVQWFAAYHSFFLAPQARVASADAEWYIIPTDPVWKGFVLNSLFYAVALAIIFAGPVMVRRHYRSRRGLCRRCAYPIGVSDRCSECGEPIPPNARRVAERTVSQA